MANWHLATYQDNVFKNNLGIINLDNTLEKYVYKLQDPIDDSITSVNENNWLRIDITHADKTVSDWVTTNSGWTEDINITGLVNGSVYWVYGAPYSYYTIIAGGKSYGLQSFSNTDGKITGKDINDSDVSIDITTITKVIIGDLVTEIGYSAFAGCSSLTSVTISDSVETIGVGAFAICYNLASVTIGDSVTTIPQGAFSQCFNLVSVNIPASVTEIGFGAFYQCIKLASVNIPASVTKIGQHAFYQCTNLVSLTFEENSNLETIDTNAFFDINSNAIITIPQDCLSKLNTKYNYTLTYGTDQSFFGSPDTVTLAYYYYFIEGGNPNPFTHTFTSYSINEDISDEDNSKMIGVSSDDGSNVNVSLSLITKIIIGPKITSIGFGAFADCTNLKSVTIPNSVTSIGVAAFGVCSSLVSLTIPDSVTSIGEYAFQGCSSLASLTIGNSVTSIGDEAFSLCTSLTKVNIPNSVTTIGYRAFYQCSSLASLTFDENSSLKTIGAAAFLLCSSLTSVKIPKSVTNIDGLFISDYNNSSPFPDNTQLTIQEGTQLTYFPSINHYYTNGKLTLNNDLTTHDNLIINNNVLLGITSKNITNITIPKTVTSISDHAFKGCKNLTSVEIPNLVTSIGDHAFDGCSSLASVTIGNSVTEIGDSAFYGCTSLASVNIPKSVTTIGMRAFTKIYINDTTTITLELGIKLTSFPDINDFISNEKLTLNTDDFITTTDGLIINNNVLLGVTTKDITNITIPKTVTSIGDGAFAGCEKLTEVTIPNSVTTIGDGAFSGCSKLESIVIPDSVTEIGDGAFYYCNSLTEVNIPNSVTTIGYRAFYECSSLASLTFGENSSLKTIGAAAFLLCSSLTEVNIPNSVTTIGSSAFSQCTSLASVNIPDSVTTIGFGGIGIGGMYYYPAFYGINANANITIPQNVLTAVAPTLTYGNERLFYGATVTLQAPA